VQDFCNDPAGANGINRSFCLAGRGVAPEAEPARRPQSFASDIVFIILGSALGNAKQFPNVNRDQDVTPKAKESQVGRSRKLLFP